MPKPFAIARRVAQQTFAFNTPQISLCCHNSLQPRAFRYLIGSWPAAPRPKCRRLSVKCTTSPTASSSWNVQQSGTRRQDKAPDLHVVLVHPEIPGNTGTVARTCAATAVGLHLVKPLGFEIDSTRLKRAGLDYWDFVVVKVHDDWQDFLKYFEELPGPKRMHAFTKFATQSYSLPGTYQRGDWLLFGAETTGLPAEVRKDALTSGGAELKIPIHETHVRSLNLAVAASVALYEGVRQLDPSMQ